MKNYNYYSSWGSYAFPESRETALPEDIRKLYTHIDLSSDEKFPSGGVPILVEGSDAYVNSRDENTIIFGETGSKKSRCVITPLIAATAGACESAVITDVKGELYANEKLQNFLRDRGIRTVCLDFRTFDHDRYDILKKAYEEFRGGNTDKALTRVTKIMSALASKFESDKDPIWSMQAMQYLCAVIQLVFYQAWKSGRHEEASMTNIIEYCNYQGACCLGEDISERDEYYRKFLSKSNYSILKNICGSTADKMVSSIMGFVYSMVQPFISEPKLARMLSRSTFDPESLYETPTFVFLIVPDETTAYEEISGLLIDSFYTDLIEFYSSTYLDKAKPPCRINFICDEFCNLRVNDMKAKISASRSRAVRWFLVCQSKEQLFATYGENAGTIIGNCRNTLFLQSSDSSLIDYICDMCGETKISRDGTSERLVKPEMLRNLRKENGFKEALFIDGNTVFFTELPDIDSYDFLKKYEDCGDNQPDDLYIDYDAGLVYDRNARITTDEDITNMINEMFINDLKRKGQSS